MSVDNLLDNKANDILKNIMTNRNIHNVATTQECQNNTFSRNLIVFGAPGTGKSYTLEENRKKLLGDSENQYERVTFHPDYTYANFVGTYKPVPEKDGDKKIITYEYVPGPFMRILKEALKSKKEGVNKPYLLLIEEINRANVAAVFGDVFQLLDRTKTGESEYAIATSKDMRNYLADENKGVGGNPDDFKEIKIPSNMYIWATMNSADQGVFPMDTAFKRRWNFEYIDINEKKAVAKMNAFNFKTKSGVYNWNKLREAINNRLTDVGVNEDKLMGPFFIAMDVMEAGEETLKDAIASKVIMYLFEDAAKQKKNEIFKEGRSARYSKLANDFKKEGLAIFDDRIAKAVQSDVDTVGSEG